MVSVPNYPRLLAAVAAIAVTAALVWFGYSLSPWWPLMWFAPLPILLFASRAKWWSAGAAAFFAWFIGWFTLWGYLHKLTVPLLRFISIVSVASLGFALTVLLFRALLRRGAAWSALLAFPALWVVGEYVHNIATPDGTAGSLAYTQLNFLPFLQLASITGPWGMSFLLLLFPAALAIGVYLYRNDPKRARRIASVSLGVTVLVLIFGTVRLALPAPPPHAKVGLIASDTPQNDDVADEGAPTDRLFRDYADRVTQLASEGAQVVVIPEKIAVVVEPNTRAADAIFQSVADKARVTIVVGVVDVAPPVKYNRARVYSPGAPVRHYDKHHMLPPFESNLKPGTTTTVLPETSPLWGVEICKDMDFTQLSRQYGKQDAGLMLVPAWDFRIDRWWHGHIAIMRGVEDGFAIARAAKDGYLTVSDNRGRILAQTRSDSAPFATLLANVPITHDRTVYLLFGDWFAWFAFAPLVFAGIQLFRPRKS